MEKSSHIPVLVKETIKFLNPQPDDVIVDATVGLGGHAEAILRQLGPRGRLIGIDQDEHALHLAHQKLGTESKRVVLLHGNFRDLADLAAEAGADQVDGILLDLGVSSLQLDQGERGFSFLHNAPLDMRMDPSGGITAAELLRTASFTELVKILKDYGEEPRAEIIAKRIIEARKRQPIATTKYLAELVGGRPGKIHPATRVFQALRIAVNDELGALQAVLPQAITLLKTNGRLVVITFHSLEDRIVKNFFKHQATGGRTRLLTKKALMPSWEERRRNHRARSAKLRALVKI